MAINTSVYWSILLSFFVFFSIHHQRYNCLMLVCNAFTFYLSFIKKKITWSFYNTSKVRNIVLLSFTLFEFLDMKSLTLPPNFPITLAFSSFITLTCCTSFPALSLCLANLYNSFSPYFFSNLAYKFSYAHPFAIGTAFFALIFFSLYIFLLFLSHILSHAFLSLSFLLCSPQLPHSITMSHCLLFVSQMSLRVQFQLFFLAFFDEYNEI